MTAPSSGPAPVMAVIAVTMGCASAHGRLPPIELAELSDNGAMVVLEPDEVLDPARDHLFVIGEAVDCGERTLAINGRREPPPLTLTAGAAHRFRIINLNPDLTTDVALVQDSSALSWVSRAHDGADLRPAVRVESPARIRKGTGETYDFAWTPAEPGDADLVVHFPFAAEPGELLRRQPSRVR